MGYFTEISVKFKGLIPVREPACRTAYNDKLLICSKVVIVVIGQCLRFCLNDLLVHLGELVLGDSDLGRSEQWCLDQGQLSVVDHATEQPDEWLLELVVALGRDVVVLEVLLPVESDLLGLDLAVAHVDLVANEDDGDGLADARQVLVPLWHIGVRDARADIEHDDAAVSTDVVAVTETSKLLLASRVPNVEVHLAVVREEGHWVHFDTERGNVALLEFTSQVALHEGRLADAAVTDENEFELGDLLGCLFDHLNGKGKKS